MVKMDQFDLFEKKTEVPKEAPNVQIDPSWKKVLQEEFSKPYFKEIKSLLIKEREQKVAVYPPGNVIFNAFNKTPFDKVKVVIIGQDPYHGKGQAHGLCFSVPHGITPPPSLKNIFKEINNDIGIPIPSHGNLEKWTTQGIFMLNAILTVRAGQPASHRNIGWEKFTDAAITKLSQERENIIFLLWGKFAQEKELLINVDKHHILKAAHPSPCSAENGFFGCDHFSIANEILKTQGIPEVNWELE